MHEFIIPSNEEYLESDIQGFHHTYYTGFKNTGNPDYLNDLKNTFNNIPAKKLNIAAKELHDALKKDLSNFNRDLTICIIPRSKAENTYHHNQLLFKKVVQVIINNLGFKDGSNYIVRHTNLSLIHI